MHIISWIVLGLIAGLLAKLIMPGKDPGGLLITIVLGICGALVGGFLATLLGFGNVNGDFDLRNLAVAILGSLLILYVYRLLKQKGKL